MQSWQTEPRRHKEHEADKKHLRAVRVFVVNTMMKYLEVRRHSKRNPPRPHLIQEGVSLARKLGNTLGHFDRVITSTLPRALETAIAMGYAVDMEFEQLAPYGGDVFD